MQALTPKAHHENDRLAGKAGVIMIAGRRRRSNSSALGRAMCNAYTPSILFQYTSMRTREDMQLHRPRHYPTQRAMESVQKNDEAERRSLLLAGVEGKKQLFHHGRAERWIELSDMYETDLLVSNSRLRIAVKETC